MNINESVKTIQEMKALCVTLMTNLTQTRAMLYRAFDGLTVASASGEKGLTEDELDREVFRLANRGPNFYIERCVVDADELSEMEQIRADYNRLLDIKEL